MKLAIVGVTGLVGTVLQQVLEEESLPITEYILVASEKSVGKTLIFNGKPHTVVSMEAAVAARPDVAVFSAGGSVSLEWAPRFAEVGCTVVDNSSAWRMDPSKKLVVPEINASELTREDKIIANPNCSTIQMVMALAPLHRKYGIDRIVVSTYQSFTGTGAKAVAQYEAERDGQKPEKDKMAYHYPIFENCIPQCDVFTENGYTKEEMKLVNETKKILGDNSLKVTATAIRVPVNGGHSESVNVSFHRDIDVTEVRQILTETPGIVVLDNPEKYEYPMPLFAKNKNEVFVGRLRRDESAQNALNMWIVADNLRKGAATNAIQIVKYLIDHQLIG
ncbi:MAG: aspartate-semialdehyde dehydrogenase [Saprospiraceae bacterium]|nr:aspartate-semialdehyde dehydrogenase [Saprospiraceae bacterium]MBK7220295.1 aspartate-semialdehyde dehydrogenase [Saprospiraceae bacterium]MBK7787494.1 aspartate-semialdehyde dehydrogenase [Saprospiraceae bacterium]MBK8849204.1 aspartate-semialdehyde dehydrogenase [Saprospiraceae bacterium]MBK9688848.1 aspartate-semialdehyde dehydrogenase [Saprospiraceae bacterium]